MFTVVWINVDWSDFVALVKMTVSTSVTAFRPHFRMRCSNKYPVTVTVTVIRGMWPSSNSHALQRCQNAFVTRGLQHDLTYGSKRC
jgi:hypothetical protein